MSRTSADGPAAGWFRRAAAESRLLGWIPRTIAASRVLRALRLRPIDPQVAQRVIALLEQAVVIRSIDRVFVAAPRAWRQSALGRLAQPHLAEFRALNGWTRVSLAAWVLVVMVLVSRAIGFIT